MPQLPSPGVTATACSRKSTASVHDTDYRETLEQYHIYIMEEKPPSELVEQAMNIISRQRETPEIDDAAIDQLRETMRGLQNRGEEEVKNKLGAVIIPGFNKLPNEKLEGVPGQLWAKSVPIPLDRNALAAPLPLPKPKPDMAFGYAKAAFDPSQLPTIKLLVNAPGGSSFASPSQDLRFPFLVIELKSLAKDGSIRVATNQAAGAGAISMNGILELISRDFRLDDFDLNKPLFFSVTMDQTVACLNVHWIGKKPDTNQHTFHLEELKMLPLKYDDSVQVLQRAVKNIFDYAADSRLKLVLDALDGYRERVVAQNNAQGEVESHAPPSPPQPALRSKKVKGTAAAGRNGLAAHKAQEETTERRTRSSRPNGQRQAEVQPTGVRTRRRPNLVNS